MASATRPTTPQEEQEQLSGAYGGGSRYKSTFGTVRAQKFTYQPPPDPVASTPGQAASAAMPWGGQNPSAAANAGGATPWSQSTQGRGGHPDWGQVLHGVLGKFGGIAQGIGERVQDGIQQWQQGGQQAAQQWQQGLQQGLQQGIQQWQQGAQGLQQQVQQRIQQDNPWLQQLVGGAAGNIAKAAQQFQIGRR